MKTISTRFLKGALAMLLAVVMLFGTTITGLAAVVDKAQTSANINANTKFYFDRTGHADGWTASTIQLMVGKSDYSQGYGMSKIDNTNLYYVNMPKWEGCTQIAVFNTSDVWGGEGNNIAHRKGYANGSTGTYSFSSNLSGNNLLTSSSGSNLSRTTLTSYTSLNSDQKATIQSAEAGSTNFVSDANAGTVSVTSYKMTAVSTASASAGTTSGDTTTASAARTATVTMKVTKTNAGYKFKGWYDGSTEKSTANTYTYTCNGSGKIIYARFEKESKHTVTFKNWDGSTLDTQTVEHGKDATAPEVPDREGYTFKGWDKAFTNVTSDLIVTAQYNINKYSVSLATAGDGLGTAEVTYGTTTSSSKVENVAHFDTVTLKAKPDDQGVSVVWTIKNGKGTFTGDVNGNEVTFTPTDNTTILATFTRNQYKATFKYLGANGDDITDEFFVVPGGALNPPTVPDRTGYKFDGWSPKVPSTISEHGITYTAKYSLIPYTITLELDGGTVESFDGNYDIETPNFKLPIPKKDGYRFLGWSINNGDPVETVIIEKGSYGDKTYTAKYIEQVTLTIIEHDNDTLGVDYYTINNERVELGTHTFDIGTPITLKAVPKDGYRVLGFRGNGIDDTAGDTREITLNESITSIYAVASELCAVQYKVYTNKVDVTKYNGAYGGTVSVKSGDEEVTEAIAGESLTYTATPATNYKFYGWFSSTDFTQDPESTNPNYTVAHKEGATPVAMFYKNYALSGAYSGEFGYDFDSNSYSFISKTYSSSAFSLLPLGDSSLSYDSSGCIGGKLEGVPRSGMFKMDEENYESPLTFTLTSSNNGATYTLRIEATEKFKIPVYCNIDGAEYPVGDFSASKSADFTVPGNDGMYVSSYTVTPDMEILFDGLKGHIKQMPSKDLGVNKVVITPTFKPYRHITFNDVNNVLVFENKKDNYKASEPVSIKVSPVPGASIKSLEFADNSVTGLQIINNNNGTYTVSGTMPDMDVNINVESEGSFKVVCEPIYLDSFTDTPEKNCKIEKKVNGTVVTDEFAPIGSTVEFTAKADKVGDATYTFIGFSEQKNAFVGSSTRSTGSKYTMKAEGNKTIYAFFVRDLYLVGDIGRGWDKLAPMTYNAETGDYSYTADVANGDFILSPIANPDSSNLMTYWSNKISLGSFTGVNCSRTNSKECVLSGLKATYTLPITLTYDTSAKQVSGSAKSVYSNIYLSSGRLDYDKGGSTAFSVASNFVAYEGSFTVTEPVVHNSERYVTANIAQDIEFVRVQTTISGSMTEYYDVEYYYVYDAEHRTSTGVKATKTMDKGVYEATIPVTGKNMYIVPLYFANEEYVAEFGGTRLKIVVDISDIAGDTNKVWGDFVSCYPFGRKLNDKNELTGDNFGITGAWPGQLMIPVEKNVFETSVVVDGTAAERLTGVVFNNYMTNSLVSDTTGIYDELGFKHGFIQTYDYNDALHIKASGYNLITFKPKTGTDGANHKDDRGKTPDFSKFIELKDRSGNNPMDLTGQSITNPNATVGYYVRCVGNMDYQTMAADKKIDPLATGQWSVEWDIYDATTKAKLGTVMSGSMYEDIDPSPTVFKSRLAKIIGKEQSDLVGKKVMISYELQTGDTNRTDGQWYGQRREDTKYKVDVKVAEFDESLTEPIVLNPDTENPNVAAYGDAYVIVEGQPKPNAEFTPSGTSELTKADLSYNRGNGYKFKGWYRYKNGAFEATNDFGISGDTTFVAVFEKLDTNSLNITHAIYSNKKDYEILSQDGTALRSVEIYAYDKTSQQAVGAPLNSASSLNGGTASAPILEDSSYLIRLTAEPQGADTFYAWYMDATTADGKATYEEVLTKDGDELKEKVVAEFVYTYTDGMPTDITIYSDIKKVDVEGKFIYIYKNRYGTESFITKTFDMTVKEIDGFEGNEGKSRCPAYMDYTPFKDPATNKIYKAYSEAEKTDYTNKGYVALNTSNQIKEKAPNSFVTQAIYYDISWYKEIKHDEKDSSIIRVYADSAPQSYTINADVDGEPYSFEGVYNTLMDPALVAPQYNEDGEKFSYWLDVVRDEKTGEIIESHIASYSPYYQYRVTENKTLEAVYDAEDVQPWSPTIESVTYTREVTDTSDYVYTDYLLAFNSSNAAKIEELKNAGENIKYGLVLVRDPDVSVNEENKDTITYPNYAQIEEHVEDVARLGKNSWVYDTDNLDDPTNTESEVANGGKGYNAFYFNLTGSTVTNYNRLVYAVKYNNANAKNYKSYAFTAYAYFIDSNDNIYISEPENVNFYELGSKPKDQVTNQ